MPAISDETVLSEEAIFQSPPRLSQRGTPTWEVAYFFPHQGSWTENEYLSLDTNWIVEFTDGCVEVLPMPTVAHQRIKRYAVRQLDDYAAQTGVGEVLDAPLPVWLRDGKYREPDVIYQKIRNLSPDDKYLLGADLVMEIVSEGERDRRRDLVTKRDEYAAAKVPEYWISDPLERKVTVLILAGARYEVHGEFRPGQTAGSVVLAGFTIDVAGLFANTASASSGQ